MSGKVGIVTLNGYVNYGNRLQNYALQEVIKTYDYNVETVWVEIKRNNTKDIPASVKAKNILLASPKGNFQRIQSKVVGKLYKNELDKKRKNIFREFSNKYITETSYKVNENNVPDNLDDEFDYFVVGSDQVWNPVFRKDNPLYFLQFASKHKRISYAPSFGMSFIPDEYRQKYAKWLGEMESLSAREEAGAKIIKELTERDAPVLVDPTLLLTKEDWLNIAEKPKTFSSDKYLLTYFLGEIDKNKKKMIKEISEQNDLKVVNLAQANERDTYLSGPSEFIYLINNADLFITDSFHGVVFSILFETPFIITDRNSKFPSMNSRIETLLSMFNLIERHISNINISNANDLFNIDFSHVPEILENERGKSRKYLSEALDLK
ncbi:polysaccharide pyruvyl transferase family protein [Oceanobacillus oncorhynchi subsp. oncorhynchi]|uniref:polysaccharide pyruvyl transferase family protein n=1 Tax=Oceanobacillus oncorhynchi TaxID=545501 RepID=UPI0031DC78D8